MRFQVGKIKNDAKFDVLIFVFTFSFKLWNRTHKLWIETPENYHYTKLYFLIVFSSKEYVVRLPHTLSRWISEVNVGAHTRQRIQKTCFNMRSVTTRGSWYFPSIFSDYDRLSSFSKMSKFWRFSAILKVDFVANIEKKEFSRLFFSYLFFFKFGKITPLLQQPYG